MCWCKAKVLPAVWELGHFGGGVFDMLTDAVRDQVGESGRVCEDAGQVFKCCCTVVLPPPVPLGWVCGVSKMCMFGRVIVKRKARIKAGFIGFSGLFGCLKNSVYFPIQKFEKIRPSNSSGLMLPLISPSAL
ncbi:hypothetical protein SAMN05660380_01984 [Xylella fastidiosa]|nr:hypothetical protein SAMN05660380_01984 [Xylella fastidiosa]